MDPALVVALGILDKCLDLELAMFKALPPEQQTATAIDRQARLDRFHALLDRLTGKLVPAS